MAYRSQRQFKQQQREYEFMQDRRADESFGEDEPLTEVERAAEWDDAYFDRLDSAPRISLWDEVPVRRSR